MGLIGSSDSHTGHPAGTGLKDPYFPVPGGLTAVVTDNLSRDSLWTSLHDRSVYATTGQRMYIEFSINGQEMGSEISDPSQVNIQARAIGTDTIYKVEILKYDDTMGWRAQFTTYPNDMFWNDTFKDTDVNGSCLYYLKVIQVDDNTAWSSPIWIDFSWDKRLPSPPEQTPTRSLLPEESPQQGLMHEDTLMRGLHNLGYL